MRNPWKSLAVLALCALAAPAVAAAQATRSAPAANVIQAIGVADAAGGVELEIRGSRTPSYTVFKLQDPPRLVVDLAGADVSAVASPVRVGRGGVGDVTTAQYQDAKTSVARVIVALDGAAGYEVAPRGTALLVKVRADADGAQAAARPAAPLHAPAATEPAAPAATAAAQTATAAARPATAEPRADGAREENVVARHVDEAEVEHPATAVTGARGRAGGVALSLDGEVARFEVIELASPPRLAIDLHGVTRAPRGTVALKGAFSRARFGRDAGKVRVVLDAAGDLPKYDVKRVPGGLAIVPQGAVATAEPARPAPRARAPVAPPVAVPEAEPEAARRAPRAGSALVEDLRFSQSGGSARVELSGHAAHAVTRPDARTLVLTLRDARLPAKLERSVDGSSFRGPVAMMSSFNQPGGDVKVVLSLRADATDAVVETARGLAWTITSSEAPAAAEAAAPAPAAAEGGAPRAVVSDSQVAGFTGVAPAYALSGAPQKREYTGRRITLDFHDIEIRNLLRLIADVSKKNIMVADDVSGKVTVSLRNVPWDQALDLILKTKGLDKEEMGNVIRIAKFEEIAKEQQARAEAAKAREPLIPLKVRILPVNFARAGDVAARVKEVLSERGKVTTDDRTNVLIVKDTQEALARAEGLVRNLDTETPQVRIESRIVEASSNFNRAIGVQWGGSAKAGPGTGNPTGLFFPNIVNAAGASGGVPVVGSTAIPAVPNYAVNLPAAIGQGSGGGVGFTFGSAGGAFNLNLVLSALENSGVVKTISAPSVSTVDNKEATIGQGLSIPFSQVSAAGVNTVFIDAKLELKVTPHVSADGSVLMKIKVTNNAPNPQLTGANGQPSISTRAAETEALVRDGETTVIGGIYTRQTSTHVSEVPFLGKIPILGFFFRNNSEQDDHTELLIFITPRVLNRQAATAAAAP